MNNPGDMGRQCFVSVIIPVHNGAQNLHLCLEPLLRSSYPRREIIVVDDASTDSSAAVAAQHQVTVLRLPRRSGPAAARNLGARHATGEILFFIDSDVVAQGDAISHVARTFAEDPEAGAIFGSYDDDPPERNFLSQFKNLFHHFVHQHSSSNAATFWAGCGAVRRLVFDDVGGFDSEKYPEPSIEDIELGYRIREQGCRIVLNKNLQAKHLKKWTAVSLIRTDILSRGVPWSELMLDRGEILLQLNLGIPARISAALVGLAVALLPISMGAPVVFYIVLLLGIAVILLNVKLYGFFWNRRGFVFLTFAVPFHLFYLLYSGSTFVICWIKHQASKPIFLCKNSNRS